MRTIRLPESEAEVLSLTVDEQRQLFLDLSDVLDSPRMRVMRQTAAQALYERSASAWGRSAPQVLRDLEAMAGRKVMGKSRFMDILRGRRGGKYPETPGSLVSEVAA